MSALACFATCPRCGGDFELVNAVVRDAGTEAVSVFECAKCKAGWFVTAQLRPVDPSLPPYPCGTAYGAQKHWKNGDKPCQYCLDANAASQKDRKAAQRRRDRFAEKGTWE